MTKSEKQSHIELWEQSGQTKKAYCETMGLKYGTFISWFSTSVPEIIPSKSSDKFIAIGSVSKAEVEVLLPNGIQLMYKIGLSKEALKMLMDV